MTFQNGVQELILNGYQVGKTATISGPLASATGQSWGIGDGYNTSYCPTFTIEEPTYWANYVLTNTDIMNIRNRSVSPTSISPSNIMFHASLSGTTGNAVQTGDTGLVNTGVDSTTKLTTLGGTNISSTPPVYADQLNYTSPIHFDYSHVMPSGTMVFFSMRDTGNNLANIETVNANPSVSINGGTSIPLTTPIWGVSGPSSSSYLLPYIMYMLPHTVVSTDVVTVNTTENWAATTSGATAAVTNYQLTNVVGGSIFPEFQNTKKNLKVGWNAPGFDYYDPVPMYKNLARGASRWLLDNTFTSLNNGYVSSFTGTAGSSAILSSIVNRCDTAPANYLGVPNGFYTLMWDGSDLCTMAYADPATSVILRGQNLTGTTDNLATYDILHEPPPTNSGIQVNIYGPDVSNIRVYPPHTNLTGPGIINRTVLKMLQGSAAVRTMGILGTNGSDIVNYSDFHQQTDYSYLLNSRNDYVADIVSVQTIPQGTLTQFFADPTKWTGHIYLQVTTLEPHNLVTGQLVQFNNTANIPMTDGTPPMPTGGYFISLNGFPFFQVYIIDDYNFVTNFSYSPAQNPQSGIAGAQITGGSFSPGGQVQVLIAAQSIPFEDAVELAVEADCDFWCNVPVLATDDCVTQMAETVMSLLPVGKKCWLEYSNECWNYAFGYSQTRYCYGMGQFDTDFSGQTNLTYRGWQWYAKRAGQVHNLFAAVFSSYGRLNDLKRVYGGQFGSTNVQNIILSTALGYGYQIDAFAVAPYYSSGPNEPSYASLYDSLSQDQLMDLSDAYVASGPYIASMTAHKAALASYPVTVLVTYEGGPEAGVPANDGAYIGSYNLAQRSREWTRHPRYASQFNYILSQFNSMGVALHMAFTLEGGNGDINSLSGSSNWPAFQRWDQPWGVGDGSDGQFDNRTDLDDLSQIVSVYGYAVKRFQQVQAGHSAGSLIKVGNKVLSVKLTY